ncbi:MAG TPA: NAD+ synthase [Spirochaetia bacterium]|nr:NAD+ synthase [Spirochaetia bacterium]
MKVACGQINPTIGDFSGNVEKILSFSEKARAAGCALVVFPELCLCGYPPMDLLEYEWFVEENLKALRAVQARAPAGIGIIVGYVDRNRARPGKALLNVASLLQDGKVLHTQAKTLLPTYDVFDEARWFEAAAERTVVPFAGERLGIAICEDIWWETEPAPGLRYPVDPVAELLNAGATLIVSISASPFHPAMPATRLSLLSAIGAGSGVPVVYVNTVGANDNIVFDGQSQVTSSEGKLIHMGKAFEEELAVVETSARGPVVCLPADPLVQLEGALVLGIRDYVRKCGFRRVHLGLSGGIDSALVAVLAVEALGPDKVDLFGLPSRYSSEGSVSDARALAEALGVPLRILSIEEIFGAYLHTLEPAFQGRPADIAEENIQARIRGTLLMAWSNKFSSLLLTTGNKSELATGYCTLYGDMSGGLAVIGDLLKMEVYAVARSINARRHLIPEAILTKPPSAELRPDQKDQDSLPPYETLDAILEQYLVKKRSVDEIAAAGFDRGLVQSVVTMVEKAEYKRRQAPPVLKVSPKAFGTGRRVPIARKLSWDRAATD